MVSSPSRLFTTLACSDDDVHAAQRLRYGVFAGELGARLQSAAEGIDRDEFDAHCQHLLLRDRLTNEVVGTYRVLSAEGAEALGGFYSATEFDLGRVASLPGLVEVGRACLHPSYRSGTALAVMLAGLARHLRESGCEYVIGCASIHVGHDLAGAARLTSQLVDEHLSPPQWRVHPLRRFDVRPPASGADTPVPALLRGYLRMGAFVCGDPAWDEEFGTADLLLLLPMSRMNRRYTHRFLRAA
jgi:putative hemolysin